jgi:hypothetical protein
MVLETWPTQYGKYGKSYICIKIDSDAMRGDMDKVGPTHEVKYSPSKQDNLDFTS